MAHAGGRPPLYTSVEELQKIIDEYFDYCDNRTKSVFVKEIGDNIEISYPAPYTMAGLARRLGMERRTLTDYAKKDQFSDTIKDAKSRIQEDVEIRLMETSNQSGAIFNLKNNFGYVDKTETDVTSKGESIAVPDASLAAGFAEYLKSQK